MVFSPLQPPQEIAAALEDYIKRVLADPKPWTRAPDDPGSTAPTDTPSSGRSLQRRERCLSVDNIFESSTVKYAIYETTPFFSR